jgi:hypothetical protein
MKLVALLLAGFITVLALSCDPQQPVAPEPTLSLHKMAPPPPPTDSTCRDVVKSRHVGNRDSAVVLLCAIQAPGPIALAAGTKGWVNGERYYLTNQSNARLDIFDAENLAFLGSVGGMIGNATAGGGTATTNGPGPSSVVFDARGRAWVTDGNSTVYVIDVDRRQIIATLNTSIPACDGGTATTHYCGRENEITYDPEHDLIFTQNPSPLDVAAPHGAIDTYATFISARFPYHILGTISFPDRRGQEAPLYDARTNRILTAVSGRRVITGTDTTVFSQYVAVINPRVRPFTVEKKYDIDCFSFGIGASPGATFGINDPSLGRFQHMVIPACGRPFIMNAATGAFINTGITQVAGGNETWYNPGDDNFYTTAGNVVGVIDARTAQFLQTVPDTGGANPAAFAERNYIFTIVQASANRTACTPFGYQATGCITVFGHAGKARDHDDGRFGHKFHRDDGHHGSSGHDGDDHD